LVKNFQYSQQSDSEDEIDSQTMDIGMNKTKKEEIVKAEQKRFYKKEVSNLNKTLPSNFLGCSFFKKLNKHFFLLMVIFLLMQSMGYNGLSDVP
jgi:hypothetical protein